MRAYRNRIGGPLMDRIDLHIDVRRIPPRQVLEAGRGTSSEKLREGVMRAREYASWRRARAGQDDPAAAHPAAADLMAACALAEGDRAFYEDAARANHMSGRAITRTLAVARTIVDMDESPSVGRRHLCEALGFRVREGLQ